MKNLKSIIAIAILAITFTACSSDDDANPIPVNEEEVITTLIATLNTTGLGTPITMSFRDLDGDGPDAAIISVSSDLAANTTYTGSLDLLNETEDPAGSITEEIEEEDDEHQFFFSSSLVNTTYADMDENGNPVGLSFTLVTGDAGTGNLTITLRHEPIKDAEGVSEGNIANAGGETDISVTFPIVVE
ncbi:hypothetical protein [Psychroserpens sp. Hel_I_66]|uniref:hypothetical protein n=1 Tax=Psychroserpens sp. Hel_I_66 TaxID=1250004 RepID=UPI000646082F|nr:hypothetical protein [Psychroserpens sp. Hel_I_66]